ncbi:MAG: hypothetical protein WCJ30_13310 [Deltaproteobacteria bacterium]
MRARIRDGDVLCFSGRTWLSRLIMRLSRGQFSHSGLAFWWEDRLMVLQVELFPGVQALPVSRAVGAYDGRVEWYSLKDELRTKKTIDALRRVAQTRLGDRYSVLDLVLVGLHYAIGTPLPRARRTDHEFVCSQFVAHCYTFVGLDLEPAKPDIGTTPDDLARSPHLVRQGVLRVPGASGRPTSPA